jgi:hypothetical protein
VNKQVDSQLALAIEKLINIHTVLLLLEQVVKAQVDGLDRNASEVNLCLEHSR